MVKYTRPTKDELDTMTTDEKHMMMTDDFIWYRGNIIHHITQFEMIIDMILAYYFCKGDKVSEIITSLLNTEFITLGAKVHLLETILLKGKYPDFFTTTSANNKKPNKAFLEKIREYMKMRNTLAHCKLNASVNNSTFYNGNDLKIHISKDGVSNEAILQMSKLDTIIGEIKIKVTNPLRTFLKTHFP